jgi:hypothetical protein
MAHRLKRNKRIIGETLSILDSNGGHLSQTARETHIPFTTIHGWREAYQNDPEVDRYRRLKNEELADRFRVVAAKAIERLNTEIHNISVDKLATVAAISTDKQLLLTGNATSITESKSSQLSNAKRSYILSALPELARINPDMPAERLQLEAENKFQAWMDSLNLTPLVTEQVQ